ncbi:hypothetical protein [Parapedobacter sp. DT-150]|uniref:hypothetical protein n=1 Tax=Parapedobacter sp. DT-150 TaxID=3396162 RepID=UPI003F19E326
MRLSVNQSMLIRVDAKQPWNPTGLVVITEETYEFVSKGRWKEFVIKTDAAGHSSFFKRPFNRYKRYRQAKWLSLIGSIDKTHDFEIGKSKVITMPFTGVLYLFANDIPNWYFNNSGKISLLIKRLK